MPHQSVHMSRETRNISPLRAEQSSCPTIFSPCHQDDPTPSLAELNLSAAVPQPNRGDKLIAAAKKQPLVELIFRPQSGGSSVALASRPEWRERTPAWRPSAPAEQETELTRSMPPRSEEAVPGPIWPMGPATLGLPLRSSSRRQPCPPVRACKLAACGYDVASRRDEIAADDAPVAQQAAYVTSQTSLRSDRCAPVS